VFDILFNNTTDIQPEIHSTDTHGATAKFRGIGAVYDLSTVFPRI
jgi:hypothetical protein